MSNILKPDQYLGIVGHAQTQMRGMGMGTRPPRKSQVLELLLKKAIRPATPGKSWTPVIFKIIALIEI